MAIASMYFQLKYKSSSFFKKIMLILFTQQITEYILPVKNTKFFN